MTAHSECAERKLHPPFVHLCQSESRDDGKGRRDSLSAEHSIRMSVELPGSAKGRELSVKGGRRTRSDCPSRGRAAGRRRRNIPSVPPATARSWHCTVYTGDCTCIIYETRRPCLVRSPWHCRCQATCHCSVRKHSSCKIDDTKRQPELVHPLAHAVVFIT